MSMEWFRENERKIAEANVGVPRGQYPPPRKRNTPEEEAIWDSLHPAQRDQYLVNLDPYNAKCLARYDREQGVVRHPAPETPASRPGEFGDADSAIIDQAVARARSSKDPETLLEALNYRAHIIDAAVEDIMQERANTRQIIGGSGSDVPHMLDGLPADMEVVPQARTLIAEEKSEGKVVGSKHLVLAAGQPQPGLAVQIDYNSKQSVLLNKGDVVGMTGATSYAGINRWLKAGPNPTTRRAKAGQTRLPSGHRSKR